MNDFSLAVALLM